MSPTWAGSPGSLLTTKFLPDQIQSCVRRFSYSSRYKVGGDDLVPVPLDLKNANLATTRQALLDFAKREASFFQKPFLEAEVNRLIDAHDGLFVAPGQLDAAPQTDRIK